MKKTAFITGATSGIGRASARRLAEAGFRIIITARRKEALEAFAEKLRAEGHDVLTIAYDVRDREACREAVDNLPNEWKEIDLLVNNAGLALGLEPEYEGDFADWDTMIDTNIKGLLNMTRFVVPGMVERNRGQIINIGSVAVRVTNIKPGLVETDFSRVRFHGDEQRADNVYKGIKPLTGEDIADVVAYAAMAPAHVQIAEVLVLATHQGSGSVIVRS